MRSLTPLNRFPTTFLALAILSACGPIAPRPAGTAPRLELSREGGARDLDDPHPLTVCEVPLAGAVVELAAHRDGLVLGAASGAEWPGLELQRLTGIGCALHPDGRAPLAAGALLDADDLGNVFVFPRTTRVPGVVPTLGVDEWTSGDDRVVKIDAAGQPSRVVEALRGIWGFGVSPEGGVLWVTACGPNGIFSTRSKTLESAIAAPQTLWAQRPGVLTNDRTFWSVGYRTCLPPAAVTPGCGFGLVRTTPEGSREVGTTVVDAGAGFEEATLARCGNRVCGLLSNAVLVWNDEGAVLQTLRAADLALAPSERIMRVSGNQHGVYLLLSGDRGARLIFVPVRD